MVLMHGVIVWIHQKQYLELNVEMIYEVLLIKSLPINLAPESAKHLNMDLLQWNACTHWSALLNPDFKVMLA